ncbi:MAG: response regulator [Polyangiaceae bacterium]
MAPRVLIVDDNLILAENLKEVLEAALAGAEVTIAPRSSAALGLAKTRSFDVAIIDLQLPDGSGVDLIAPLREAAPRVEIVLLTGNATVESAIAALRAGAAGFMLKSFSPDDLVVTVEQALSRGALRRARELYEKRYLAIANAADVLIVGLDVSGSVVFWNPMLGQLLGVAEADAVGRVFANAWVDAPDRALFTASLGDVRKRDAAREIDVGMHDHQGAVRRIRWHLSHVHDEGLDTPDHVYGIGVDVTARRALERRAASAEALNAMAPLALGLAHEIRNPLNAAVLELHLLGRSIDRLDDVALREPMRRRVQIVESEIRRLERLLTEFLELARPRPAQRERVDLAAVVESVLDLESGATLRAGITVRRELASSTWVEGDVEKLKQVVLNLVVNALDAMPDGGTIDAVVRVDADAADGLAVVCSLSDTGKGIDPTILADVFDPFFTTKPAGTGLGLAIVRKIVEQHGGRVALKTNAVGGALVEVRLPRWERVSRPGEKAASTGAPASSRAPTGSPSE